MNELQVRVSADIASLQSALIKAKKTLKDFGDQSENSTDGLNDGLAKSIGLIEALENKSKALRTSLRNATDEKEIARYNAELEQTVQEMTRLNALGRTLGSASGGAAGGINKLAQAQGNANGVAVEFNRIIQDAPFGLIGIGNNITQLTQSFGSLKAAQGSTGAALKATLSSLVSPANLVVLGISAITAAFTAYQMGAFDFLKSTEDAGKALKDYNEEIQSTIDNLSAFEKVSLNTANGVERERIELDSLFAILRDTNLSQDVRIGAYNKLISQYPKLLNGLTQEKALTGDLTTEYNLLSQAIEKKALASALEGELIDSFKEQFEIQKQFNVEKNREIELQNKLAVIQEKLSALRFNKQLIGELRSEETAIRQELEKQSEIVGLTQRLLNAQGTEAKQLKDRLVDVNKELAVTFGFDEKQSPIKILSNDAEQLVRTFERIPDQVNEALDRINLDRLDLFRQGVEAPVTAESGKASTAGIIIPEDLADNFEDQAEKIKLQVDDLAGAFTGLGSLIGSAFKNPQFGTFIGQFTQFVTKVVAGAFAVSKANAVAGATQSSLFTGPAAAFTLPAFIAGAVGLVASAFAGLKGAGSGSVSGGGGGAGASAPSPVTFGNAAAPPSPFNPDLRGFSSGFAVGGGRLTAEVSGDSLIFVLEQAQEKRKRS